MKEPPARRSFRTRPLTECLRPATEKSLQRFGFADARLMTDWPKIVGDTLATHSLPVRITRPRGEDDGSEPPATLTVQVTPGFAPLIQHQEPMILERIATFFGFRAVAKLRLVQAPLPVPPPPMKRKAPLVENLADPLLAEVADPELKQALARFAAAMRNA